MFAVLVALTVRDFRVWSRDTRQFPAVLLCIPNAWSKWPFERLVALHDYHMHIV
jgi:hypothetical protein